MNSKYDYNDDEMTRRAIEEANRQEVEDACLVRGLKIFLVIMVIGIISLFVAAVWSTL